MSKVSATARWSLTVLSWFVMMFFAAALGAALIVPRLAGATPYVIETSSMEPKMPPGTLVVVRPVDQDEIKPGDVITYQIKSGDPTVVTHRVVLQGVDATGEPRWRTKGDANEAMDAHWVLPVQVKGERWYAIPYLGYVTSFVTSQQRGVLTVLVALGLLGYAVVQLVGARRDKRRRVVVEVSSEPAQPRQGVST